MWDDVVLRIPEPKILTPQIVKGVVEWYMSSHNGNKPMVIRLSDAHYCQVMVSLKDNCERDYGVPVLPEGGFQKEDERELAWIP